MHIPWDPPEPRPGLAGAWDRFVGPGATPAEQNLGLLVALAGGLAAPVYALAVDAGWSAVQGIVAALLAFDLAGGVWVNATATAKRWYHRAGQGPKEHLTFVSVHVLHLAVVAWLFRGGDWAYLLITAGMLIGAAGIIVRAPLYLQRPAALTLYAAAVVVVTAAFAPTRGLEWFVLVFYLKLLVSHLLDEAPYAPPGRAE